MNVDQHWHHDVAGAAQHVHNDFGIDNNQAQQFVQDLAVNEDGDANAAVEQDEWAPWMAEGNNDNLDQLMEEVTVVHVDHQESFSLDQSGSTASYMRVSGVDYVLNVHDFSSSSSEATSATSVLPMQPSQAFQEV